jgi:ATP-dependent Clp protease ATP-binding subunit ClpA
MIAVELEIVLRRTFDAARKARHRFVTPEHLLLQLLGRKAVVEHLEANAVRVAKLKDELRAHLARAPAFPPTVAEPDTEPTLEFQKTLQRAIREAQAHGQREVTVLDVLPPLLDSRLGLPVTRFLRGSAAPASAILSPPGTRARCAARRPPRTPRRR